MRALFLSVAIAASTLLFQGETFARTASCPCGVCTCAPCTCGGGSVGKTTKSTPSKTSKSESYHKDRERHEGHGSHAGVGVGANIDLGGIGHRRAEPDPFAVGGGQPVAHTQEKHKAKTPDHEPQPTNPFTDINPTGPGAKEENTPPGPINVNNDEVERPALPPKESLQNGGRPTENAPFTEEDLGLALKHYQQLRDRFPGVVLPDPPPDSMLKRLFYRMTIASPGVPRRVIEWLGQHPDELAKILKASAAVFAAQDNYDKGIWKLRELNKDKYENIPDPENVFDALHEEFDSTAEGKQLGQALWDANLGLQNAWIEVQARQAAAQSIQK